MKSLWSFLLLGFATMLILISCKMERRVYMSGYHVEWNTNKKQYQMSGKNNEEKNKQNKTILMNESERWHKSDILSDDNYDVWIGPNGSKYTICKTCVCTER